MKSSYNLELAAWGLGFAFVICAYGFFVRRFKKRWVRSALIIVPILSIILFVSWASKDLVKGEPIRPHLTHIEMYNAAVNTFRTRYNGLPGDHASITKYFPKETHPDIQNGNGNRQIEGDESVQFWKQLEAAELIPVGVSSDGVREINSNAPFRVVVYSSAGRNWYQIARYATEEELKVLPGLTPEQAFIIDRQIDDGKPFTGSVTIRSAAQDGSSHLDGDITQAEVGYEAGNAYACVNESDISTDAKKRTATYAIGNENLACSIRIRMN